MNLQYRLTQKAARAREIARQLFTPAEIDRITEAVHRANDSQVNIGDCMSDAQREAFKAFVAVFPVKARVSHAKAFFILADFCDSYRTKENP